MFRWCSFCQVYIGQKEPLKDYSLTHGICSHCKTNLGSSEDIDNLRPIISFYDELRSCIDLGNFPESKNLVKKGKVLKIRPADLLAGIIQPLLYDIGSRYERGELEIYQEHQFSNFTRQLVNDLFEEYKLNANSTNPEILLFLSNHEYHEFGVKFLEVLFKQEGISAKSILPGLPIDQIFKVTQKYKPKVVCISVTIPEHFEELKKGLTLFKDQPDFEAPLILIGGQGADPQAQLSVPFAQVHQGTNDSLMNVVRSYLNRSEKKAS